MKLFLGIDGGQSSTVALIADGSGRILGSGVGGPCNHVAAGHSRAKFARALEESLGPACTQAGLSAADVVFQAACLGFSGGAADKEALCREFIRAQAFKITHDAEIALTGATGGQPGTIVIAGTGSIAFGKNAQGKTVRAGGWGYLFGDEGGAFHIGKEALRAALATEETWGQSTILRDMLLEKTGAVSANLLLHSLYHQFDRQSVAAWAPLVDQAAEAGDPPAISILQRSANHLANLAAHVESQLFAAEEKNPVCYVGGVFKSALLTNYWSQDFPGRSGPPAFPPAAGALLEALRLAGIEPLLSNLPVLKS